MRRRRARSVDAVTMEGTMVAEAGGDLPLQEEERGGEPRRGQRQEVDVNPFWKFTGGGCSKTEGNEAGGSAQGPGHREPPEGRERDGRLGRCRWRS